MTPKNCYYNYSVAFGYLSSLLVVITIAKYFDLNILDNYLSDLFSDYSTQHFGSEEVPRILLDTVRYLLSILFVLQCTNAIAILLIPVTLFNFGQIELSQINDEMLSLLIFSLIFAVPLNLALLMLFG